MPNISTQVPLQILGTTLGQRLQTLGDVFSEFRFRRITTRLHPASTAAGIRGDYVVSYSKDINAVPPVTLADAYQLTSSRLSASSDTVPIPLQLPMAVLRNGPRVWYTCNNAAGSEVQDFRQGTLYVLSTTALVVQIEIGYEIQFRGATTPSVD